MKIGLVQINNSFSGQNYLPYSIACLQSYIQENIAKEKEITFLPHIYKRMGITKIVDHLKTADIVGFSTYVWNAEISLKAAQRVKKNNPNCFIVFGGPHVPDDAREFLEKNDFIDVAVHNEGEIIFNELIKRYPKNNWQGIKSISYIDKQTGEFIYEGAGPRMTDLSAVPSPFLNGIFDDLIAKNPDEKWIGLWETNRGCPFQCTFCDWGSATAAKVSQFEMERLYKEIEWMCDKKIEYIFVCDANFGIKKRDIDIAKYVEKMKKMTGFPQGFSVQNTKNATERAYQTQKILADAGLNKGIALSMQSLDKQTLINIKRDNISLDTYFELAKRFSSDGAETYSDLILGLPGETFESFRAGVEQLVFSGQHNRIQFNNLSILPNAEMGSAAYLEKFGIKTVRSKIINIHGSREILEDDVDEYQDLVVATNSMPEEEWQKARTFAWIVSFLYYDKILQIPIMILLYNSAISFSTIIEKFMFANKTQYPVMGSIVDYFIEQAQNIQKGGEEYAYSSQWLDIYWPMDEYIFIQLTVNNTLYDFFDEANQILQSLIDDDNDFLKNAVSEAVILNKKLISQPHLKGHVDLSLQYNILDFWTKIKNGEKIKLEKTNSDLLIDRNAKSYDNEDDWFREVVWWGNKKGAYLYQNIQTEISPEIAGHY